MNLKEIRKLLQTQYGITDTQDIENTIMSWFHTAMSDILSDLKNHIKDGKDPIELINNLIAMVDNHEMTDDWHDISKDARYPSESCYVTVKTSKNEEKDAYFVSYSQQFRKNNHTILPLTEIIAWKRKPVKYFYEYHNNIINQMVFASTAFIEEDKTCFLIYANSKEEAFQLAMEHIYQNRPLRDLHDIYYNGEHYKTVKNVVY